MALSGEGSFDGQSLIEECARQHPGISVWGDGLDSVPHLVGTTLTVAKVLERLYVHGSFSAVAEYYSDVTEDQVREATLFAVTFLEAICRVGGLG